MKQGRDLTEIAGIIYNQLPAKHDYIAPTERIALSDDGYFHLADTGQYLPTKHSLHQLTDSVGIRWDYIQRMLNDGATDLLAKNVNHWLRKESKNRMIRTIDTEDGTVMRAYLSDRYRPLDNWDLLSAIMPTLEQKELVIRSSELTDTKLYLKATLPALQDEVKPGDIIEMGIVISNSEVGDGSVRVQPLIYRLVCTNGMIAQASIQKYHIGRRIGNGSADIEYFLRDETREADDRAFWMMIKDVVEGTLSQGFFYEQVYKLKEAAGLPIKRKVEDVVEITRRKYSLSEQTGSAMLENIIRSNDLTKYGLANAITNIANTTESYEYATELENIGGKVIELPRKEWEAIAA